MSPAEGDLRALSLLMRVAEPADPALSLALDRDGPAGLLADLREGRCQLPGAPALRRRLAGQSEADDLAVAERIGARLVMRGSPQWPRQLDDLGPARPYGLWIRGRSDLRMALLRSASMVGARAATAYGLHVATELAGELAERGWCVVSGAALGIDGAAHRAALSVNGSTVAVLAGGIDIAYPASHAVLLERIAGVGALISEAGFGAAPAKRRFLTRNRMIAALTRGTVVVEAAVRSGAATTARYAGELGRPVLAVPGPVTSAASIGTNELLRSGAATAVTRAVEVIEDLGELGADLAEPRVAPTRAHDDLPARLAQVLEALPARSAASTASIAGECGLPESRIAAGLGELSVLGLAERVDGGWRATVAACGRSDSPTGTS